MSTKNDILNNTKRHINARYDMPNLTIDAITYSDKVAKFIESSKAVGGKAIELKGRDINTFIKELYPEAKTITSNLSEINIATINPDEIDDPRTLNGTDLGIIQGEVGVAENGTVWIPQTMKQKAVLFISEYLVILLNKVNVVNNMHEAYEKVNIKDVGFGTFISGPSKTADIEQALVVGAHGAKGVTIILK